LRAKAKFFSLLETESLWFTQVAKLEDTVRGLLKSIRDVG